MESYSRTRWLDKLRPAGAPHRWMGRRARWHLSWPLADTTAQKKKTTFLDSCMSSLRLSMLFFSVSFKRETHRIMFVILLQGPLLSSARADVEIFLRRHCRRRSEKNWQELKPNVPLRFQSRVQHAKSIRLSHAVVHHRSSTIS